jgi:rubrerythrin
MSNPKLAAPELAAIDIKGHTRQAFIMRGAVAAGSVYGLATVGPFVRQAIAQGGGGDVEILNFALTLEFLEAAFYEQALAKTSGLSSEVSDLAKTIQQDEAEHVDALMATIEQLGGKPVAAPKVDFGNAFASEQSFLKLAQTFEDTGVSAYNGAAPEIQSKEVLAAAGGIVQVEARHAAAIRLLNGANPAPMAFDETLTMDQVLEAVNPFVKS